MAENRNKLFREKSIEAIESPESLNDYLKVTSPGVWLLLLAVVLILLGTVVWGIFGRIEKHERVAVISDGVNVTCVVSYDDMEGVSEHPSVEVNGQTYALDVLSPEPGVISEETDVYTRLAGDYDMGTVVYTVKVDGELAEGTYTGKVVTESLQPMSLLLN